VNAPSVAYVSGVSDVSLLPAAQAPNLDDYLGPPDDDPNDFK
jgi:hypothetical protein